MPNMSYCRFRNTLTDLRDCYEALGEDTDPLKGLSPEEAKAARSLLKLCDQITEEYVVGGEPEL